jgi:hypothetical protein
MSRSFPLQTTADMYLCFYIKSVIRRTADMTDHSTDDLGGARQCQLRSCNCFKHSRQMLTLACNCVSRIVELYA